MAEKMTKEEWYNQLFLGLGRSKFRSSFHLKQKDIDYINEKGLDTIREHAREFIAKREAPAVIPNDGKQTPMKGHPVFEYIETFYNTVRIHSHCDYMSPDEFEKLYERVKSLPAA